MVEGFNSSMLDINGYPLIRIDGRNKVELIFLFICAAGVPVTLIALGIILRNTPPQMKIYKWIIVNLTVTTFITDFTICFLFDAIPLFPDIACYSKAWLPNVSEDAMYIMLCVCIVMLQMTLCSTLVAFLYRMQALGHAIGPFPNISDFGKFIMAVITYILGLIPIIVILITSYSSSSKMRKTLEHYPHLKFLDNYKSYLIAERDDKKFLQFEAVWLGTSFIIVALCMFVAALIITNLHKRRNSMSIRSLELHRSLTIHLILQITIPAVTTLFPMVVLLSSRFIYVPFGAEFWNLIISQTVALHSPLNTIALLFLTRHYRRVIIAYVMCSSSKVNKMRTNNTIKVESTIGTAIQ